jgi:preprotein translocase subunit YajC
MSQIDNSTPGSARWRRAQLGAILGLAAIAVAACGGGSTPAASSPSTGSSNRPQFATNFDDVSGKVTAVSGATASVQAADGSDVTVAWASITRFNKVSVITLSSIAKGDCVTVTGAPTTVTSNGTPATKVTALSVSVTSTSGCPSRPGFGTFGGGGAPGNGGTPPGLSNQATPNPSATPSPNPSRGQGFGGGQGFGERGFGGAFGTVESVTSSSFVVKSAFGSTTVKVSTNAKTTFSATAQASASAVSTGLCAAAIGAKTSNGTIDARMITLSAPSNGRCPVRASALGGGFGGFGRGGSHTSAPVGTSAPVASA